MNRAPSPHPSPPLGERVSEGRVRGIAIGSRSQCTRKNERGLFMNRSLKSGSKLHALQTLRAGMWPVHFAKRLECVRLAGALRSGVQCAMEFEEVTPPTAEKDFL